MKKQNFLEGSLVLIASAALAKVIGAVFRIPLANMLGGAGMGYFSSAYGVFTTFYAVCVTGIPVAAASLTAECVSLGEYGRMKKTKRAALIICALGGAFFMLLMLLLAYPFCALLSGSPAAVFSAAAIAPSVLFGAVTAVYRGYYEGQRNMYPTAVSQVTEAAVKLVSGLILCRLVLYTYENCPEKFEEAALGIAKLFPFKEIRALSAEELVMPLAAAAAAAGVSVSSAAGTLYIVLRDILSKNGLPRGNGGKASFGETASRLLSFIIPVSLGALVTNLTTLIDIATVIRSMEKAVSASPERFSRYLSGGVSAREIPNFFFGCFTGLAVTVFNLIPSFTNMFGKSAVPAIAGAFAEKDGKKLRQSAMNVIFTAAFIAVPAGIGISALSPQILELLFPSRRTETAVCALPLRVLGAGVIFLSVSSVLFSVLQAAGKSREPVKIMLCGVIVKLLLNLALVPLPGLNITGAAVSTSVCYLVIMVLSVNSVSSCAGISRTEVYSMLYKLAVCGAICGETAFFTDKMLRSVCDTRFTLIISVGAGALFYIISTHLLGILNKSTLKLLIS